MTPAELQLVKRLFQEAADLPADQRTAWLASQPVDRAVREQVERQLRLLDTAAEDLAPAVSRPDRGETIDRYRLLAVIGEGGFGTVWRAEQVEPIRRIVALKVLKIGMDTRQVVARFEVERQALAMMDHPHIAAVYDGGTASGGRPYFVMELVEGEPITEYCDRHRQTTTERLELFQLVCGAVQHAHQKGVIHRDLKPSNVLVTDVGGEAVPKVIDFGVAKATGIEQTRATLMTEGPQLLGTFAYMAPEQVGGARDVDTRADVYGLGVLLYELLAGALPFVAATSTEPGYLALLEAIREQDPPRPSTRVAMPDSEAAITANRRVNTPSQLQGLLRGDLDWIVMRALEKDRDRRYASAAELAADIGRHLRREPVLASPPSATYRLRKLAARYRVAFAGIGAVLLTVLVGATVAAFGWREAREQARHARAQALTRAASQVAEDEPELALILARAALRLRPGAGALSEIHRALSRQRELWSIGGASGARFTPDGTQVLLTRGTVVERRSVDGRLLSSVDLGTRVSEVDMSADGSRLLVGGEDGFCIWDSRGHLVGEVRAGDTPFAALALSPDGRHVLVAADREARLLTSDGRVATRYPELPGPIGHVAFSLGGDRVLASVGVDEGAWQPRAADGDQYTAQCWDLGGRALGPQLVGHTDAIVAACFDSSGEQVLTASHDGTARVWRIADGSSVVLHHDAALNDAAFHPDGDRVVTAGFQRSLRIWRTNGELLSQTWQSGAIMSVAISVDGTRLLASCADAKVHVLDMAGEELLTLRGQRSLPQRAHWSPDGSRVIGWEFDGTARLWQLDVPGFPVLRGPKAHLYSVEFSPDGRELVAAGGSGDSCAHVWSRPSHGLAERRVRHEDFVFGASFGPRGERLVTASADGTAIVCRRDGGEPVTLVGHTHRLWDARLSPDGNHVATASDDGTVRIWDLQGHERRRIQVCAVGRELTRVCFSKDGKSLLAISDAGSQLWATEGAPSAWRMVRQLPGGYRGALSPDGQLVLLPVGAAATLYRRDGTPVSELRGHGTWITSAKFSHDGQQMATASRDGSARVWDLQGRLQLAIRDGHEGLVWDVAFSPDDEQLATCGVDGTVRIWPVRRDEILARVEGAKVRRFAADELEPYRELLGEMVDELGLDVAEVRDR